MSESRKNVSAPAKADGGMIQIYLPLLPDEVGVGEVDQRVTVTVNGVNRILPRGEMISVTPEEYEILRNSGRFDKL